MSEERRMTQDGVCGKYGEGRRRTKISMQKLPVTEPDDPDAWNDMILVEAPAHGLRFLGELFLAMASATKDCHFYLGPRVAGSWFFERSSEMGLYIHRLPCPEGDRLATGRPRKALTGKEKHRKKHR